MTENIEVFGQNSIRIRSGVGAIYIDPFRMTEEPKDAAFVLLTHDHYDHFSPKDIAKVVCDTTVMIVPEKMKEKAEKIKDMVSRKETVRQD